MWETIVSTIAAIAIAYYFSNKGQGGTQAGGLQPNLSGQAPLQAPGVTSGYAVPATSFLANALPQNPFTPNNSISTPVGSDGGSLPSISLPGDSLYYAPVQSWTFAGPSYPQPAEQPSTLILPIVMGSPAAAPEKSGCSCGQNPCCSSNCPGNNTRFPDGRGGCLQTQKSWSKGATPDQWLNYQNQIGSIPGLDLFNAGQQEQFDAQSNGGPGMGVPAAPARKFSFSQY